MADALLSASAQSATEWFTALARLRRLLADHHADAVTAASVVAGMYTLVEVGVAGVLRCSASPNGEGLRVALQRSPVSEDRVAAARALFAVDLFEERSSDRVSLHVDVPLQAAREQATGRPHRPVGAFEEARDLSVQLARVLARAPPVAHEPSDEAFGEFASLVAGGHDLRAPLRRIRSFVDLLERKHAADLGPEATGYLGHVAAQAARMQATMSALQRYGDVVLRRLRVERVDLTRTVTLTATKLGRRYPLSRVDVQPLPEVMADAALMNALVTHLLSNALKFTAEGEVADVRVWAESSEDRLCIYVRDQGIGIAPMHHGEVWSPFFRANSRDLYDGVGLGLAACQSIARRHGGTLTLESAPGKGSTLCVELPMVTSARGAPGAARR